MSGYIKLHRGWRDCEAFQDAPFSEREAWLWLLENVAWKDTHRRAGKGNIIEVGRGQIHTSERTLASIWQWDRKRVTRFLKRLKTAHMITPSMGPSGALITVCNYAKYQSVGAIHGANDGADNGAIHGATQEEGKEEKKEEGGGFAFSGDVIRLTFADFRKWQNAYPDIDLRALLQSRDDWLLTQPEEARKRWFLSTSNWLAGQQGKARREGGESKKAGVIW